MTVKEYLEHLEKIGFGISPTWLYTLLKRGMPHEEKGGITKGRIIIDPVNADAWIEQRRKEKN